MNEPQAYQTPLEELIIQKCWVPDCPHIAAFRDGTGWWWCITHQDRQMWGIEKVETYDEVVKRAREIRKEKQNGIC